MPFDSRGFQSTNFIPRTAAVSVPDLKQWFPEGEAPEFKVRGLNGYERARCVEGPDLQAKIIEAIRGLLSSRDKDVAAAIMETIGANPGRVPKETAIRLSMFEIGCVDPVGSMDLAIKVCTAFPIEFQIITDKILELTGAGHTPGK
jgi:hypothetical protein